MSRTRAVGSGGTRLLDLITAAFVTVLVVSNVASSAKIVDWGVSLFGVRLAFDAGTLLFPVSYVFGDVLTEVYGYRRSRRVIWTGFVCLAVSSLVLWVVRILPGEAGWEAGVGQAAFEGVLGGMSSGGIVLASLVAYVVGEFSNSVVLARLKVAHPRALAVDAHHRQHARRRGAGHRDLRRDRLGSPGCSPGRPSRAWS